MSYQIQFQYLFDYHLNQNYFTFIMIFDSANLIINEYYFFHYMNYCLILANLKYQYRNHFINIINLNFLYFI